MSRQPACATPLTAPIVTRAALARCLLTLQAVSEFYRATTRKGMMAPGDARQLAEPMLTLFPTAAASAGAVRTALELAANGRSSYWHALLLATAAEAGCAAILTEDLADGSVLAGVRIINPFAGSVLSPGAEALLADD
ncbi:MAG TPA: hypothetical protein VMB34_04540 [Acetobacteraceae bacterium]|nr:hypothetical protein [Acetobacteraceae bacterium]